MLRFLLASPLLFACVPGQRASVTRTVSALGTEVTIQVSAPERAIALAASETLLSELEAAEQRLSTWREDSELASINGQDVGSPARLSTALRSELEQVFALQDSTGGAFDPAVGPLIEAWSLRSETREPSPAELEQALEAVSAGFKWDEGTVIRQHEEAALEEGAWGKGAALDAALATLRSSPAVSATVDLGGQHSFLRESGSLLVADPRGRELPAVASIDFEGEGSLATTGNSERGQSTGHILDPRTGRPAIDFGSVTVWAQDGLTADALSTALFVLGPAAGLEFVESRADVEALFVVLTDPDHPNSSSLHLRASSGFRGQLRSHSPHPPAVFSGPR